MNLESIAFRTYTYADIAPEAFVEQAVSFFPAMGHPLQKVQLLWMTPVLSTRTGWVNDKTLARLRGGLAAGKITSFDLAIFVEGHDWYTYGGQVLAQVAAEVHPDREGDAKGFAVVVRRTLLGEDVRAAQERVVGLAKGNWLALQACHGYVERNAPGAAADGETYYEVAWVFKEKPPLLYREYTSGYYWGMLLSEGHLARLGGLERVKREAPVAQVEVLGEGKLVYLQLTEDIREISREQLVALRRFLTAVLQRGKVYDHEEALTRGDLVEDVFAAEEGAKCLQALIKQGRQAVDAVLPPRKLTPGEERRGKLGVELLRRLMQGGAEAGERKKGVGKLKVELGELSGVDVLLTVVFKEPLTEEQEKEFTRLVEAWYVVGMHGGFGGRLHNLGYEKLEDGRSWDIQVDFGSAKKEAAQAFWAVVESFGELAGVEVERARMGDFPLED